MPPFRCGGQVPERAPSTGQSRREANHVADQIERVRSVDGGLNHGGDRT